MRRYLIRADDQSLPAAAYLELLPLSLTGVKELTKCLSERDTILSKGLEVRHKGKLLCKAAVHDPANKTRYGCVFRS